MTLGKLIDHGRCAIFCVWILAIVAFLSSTSWVLAAPPTSFELGSVADHFLDLSGDLSIADVTSTAASVRFVAANGTPANYGPQPNRKAVLWLRIPVPQLNDDQTHDWILSIVETRIRKVEAFLPGPSGWKSIVWDGEQHGNSSLVAIRYPAIAMPSMLISGHTIYLRIETASSMRAVVMLQRDLNFAASYGMQSFLFGLAAGVLGILSFYLFANGLATSDRTTLILSAFTSTYLLYILSHQAFLETHLAPGALKASRLLSILSSTLLFSWWLFFTDGYLRIAAHRPALSRIMRVVASACLLFAIATAVAVIFEWRFLRRFVPMVGIGSLLLGIVVAIVMVRVERKRAAIFLLCWSMGLAAGILRLLHDVVPALGANPYALNATYAATCLCFSIFGVITSVEAHQRERALRASVEATTDRLRDFAHSASDSFWETDGSGRITFATGPAAAFAGLHTGVLLTSAIAAGSSNEGQNVTPSSASVIDGRPLRHILSLPGETDVTSRYVDLRGTPRMAADGTLLGYRGVASDITEDILGQRRQAQQQKLAAVGRLAGGVAHEINNLLHPIINLARRAAEQTEQGDERRRWLNIVVDSGKSAAEIVKSLLTSVRPAPDVIMKATLSEGVARALKSVQSVVPQGVRLTLTDDGTVGPVLPVHEVFQLVANLVANAVHATRGGGQIGLDIRSDRREDSAKTIFSVTDEGEGMDSETLQQALDPFFTTKEASEGTGLGLYVVHEIVRGWNASLDMRSTPDQGTAVTITFPL